MKAALGEREGGREGRGGESDKEPPVSKSLKLDGVELILICNISFLGVSEKKLTRIFESVMRRLFSLLLLSFLEIQ